MCTGSRGHFKSTLYSVSHYNLCHFYFQFLSCNPPTVFFQAPYFPIFTLYALCSCIPVCSCQVSYFRKSIGMRSVHSCNLIRYVHLVCTPAPSYLSSGRVPHQPGPLYTHAQVQLPQRPHSRFPVCPPVPGAAQACHQEVYSGAQSGAGWIVFIVHFVPRV